MPRRTNRPKESLSQTNGLRFAPGHPPAPAAPQTIETKAAPAQPAARRRVHAWEMTLEEFRQHFFPELCGEDRSSASVAAADAAPQRNAA
jgi:hypothetical protein